MLDNRSFESLTLELLPQLYKLASGILRNQQDGEDAVQQAIQKAWEHRARTRPDSFRPWLTRIVINECRNIQRHRLRQFPMELPPAPEQMPPNHRDLYEAIDQLADDLRMAMMIKYFENYSEKEPAQALGISLAALKSRLFRARRKLSQMLDREVAFE